MISHSIKDAYLALLFLTRDLTFWATFLLRTIALNLSKSEFLDLKTWALSFLANPVLAHFFSRSYALMFWVSLASCWFLKTVVIRNLVRANLFVGITCLGTPVVGPFTMILFSSMMSITTAVF